MTLDSFIADDQHNLELIRQGLPPFRDLMPSIDELYLRSASLVPKEGPPFFGENLLLCHKAFLCAAVTIGRRHPDDAAPITRRAIELASIVAAVKHDPSNLERWRSEEERFQRWNDRLAGRRPRHFTPNIQYPPGPGLEELRSYLGILSDAFVHPTPEFASGQSWETQVEEESDLANLSLIFLTVDQQVIEEQLLLVGGVHVRILNLFDEVFDERFRRDTAWVDIRDNTQRLAQQLAARMQQNRGQADGDR